MADRDCVGRLGMRCTLHGPQMRKMQKLAAMDATRNHAKKESRFEFMDQNERNKTDDHALSLLL